MNRSTKRRVKDLAFFGGEPCVDRLLHVGRPSVGDRQRFLGRVEEILDTHWFSNDGPMVRRFEAEIAARTGVRHCVAVCNATLGLELVVRALGLSGEVIVPAFTFVATAHALRWHGITPVFCDVDPRTHNLDPSRVSALIRSDTTGILGVHLWGRPCAVEELNRIARTHRLAVFFDAAHAFGCFHAGTPIGGFGRAEVFSFHATKFVNSFEGGAVTTNDESLAERLRLMRNFGFSGYDTVVGLGINGKMTEVAAAMGLTNLDAFDELISVNRSHHFTYRRALADVTGLSVMPYDEGDHPNYQYLVVEMAEEPGVPTRDRMVEILHAEGILARRYFSPGCHRMEPYRQACPETQEQLSVTDRLARTVLTLPTGPAVSDGEIHAICATIRFVTANWPAIEREMSSRSPRVP